MKKRGKTKELNENINSPLLLLMANRCCNCCANACWCWANGVSGGGGWMAPVDGECGTPLPTEVVSLALPDITLLLLFVPLFGPPVTLPEALAAAVAVLPIGLPLTTLPLPPVLPPLCIAFDWNCCIDDNELVICCCCCCCRWCCCCCCWAELILLPPLPPEGALAKMELLWMADDKIEPFAFAAELFASLESL